MNGYTTGSINPPPPANINLPRKQQTMVDGQERQPVRKVKAKKPVVDENADYFAELGMESSHPVSKKSRRGK